jgi:hypothetical protein
MVARVQQPGESVMQYAMAKGSCWLWLLSR